VIPCSVYEPLYLDSVKADIEVGTSCELNNAVNGEEIPVASNTMGLGIMFPVTK
jgi:hypothetical protein